MSGLRDLGRALAADTTDRHVGWEKATVTALDPFTIQLADGTTVAGVARLRSCLAGVGDAVVVRKLGGDRLVIDAIDSAGPPLVKIGARTVSQLIPTTTDQVLAFAGGDVGIDSHGWADAANDRVVPDIEGWYRVVASCRSTGNFGIGDRLVLSITVGGVTYAVSDNVHGGTARIGAAVASVVYCDGTAADDIDVRIFQNTGGGATFEWTYSVELVRPDDI